MAKTQAELRGDPVKKPNPGTNTSNRITNRPRILQPDSDNPSAPPSRTNSSSNTELKFCPQDKSSLSAETVFIRVGTAKKDFTFHESLLWQHSGFLSRCFRGTQGQYFMEGLTKVCKLEECEIEVFSYVNEWLHTQKIKQTGNVKEDGSAVLNALLYIEIWKPADFLKMFRLMDYAINQLKKTYDQRDKAATASDLQ